MTIQCRNCGSTERSKSGHSTRAADHAWAQANPDKVRARDLNWRLANMDKFRAKIARRRALLVGAAIGEVTALDRVAILAENGGRCVYCDTRVATALDHVVPLTRGGAHAIHNLAGACKSCNSSKSNKLLGTEWLPTQGVA